MKKLFATLLLSATVVAFAASAHTVKITSRTTTMQHDTTKKDTVKTDTAKKVPPPLR